MDIPKVSRAPTRRITFYDGPDSPFINRRSSTFTERKTAEIGKSTRGASGPADKTLENAEAEQDYVGALVMWKTEISKLTKSQLDLFLQCYSSDSLQDYTETLRNAIAKREDNSRILGFTKRVRPVYDFVRNFTPVVNAASEFSPVPFSAVLGGITCILSIGVKVDDYQAKMVETLEKMISQLERLEDYKSEALFEHDAKMEASQVNVTTDILKFCVAAAKILFDEKGKPHNILLHLLKLQLKDFNATFGGIEAQFLRHLEELEHRRKFHESRKLHHVYRVVDKIDKDNEVDRMERKAAAIREQEARERKEAEERRQCVLNWLQFIPFTAIQDTTYCNRVEETGDWLLEDPKFKNWRQGIEPARLWIHGKAGSGKSFLAARVINDLKKYVASETAEISAIAYAYCSSTKLSVELTYNGILSSLLRQLYDQLPLDQGIISIESRARSSSEGATRSELKEWIQVVIARLRSCFFIIDGLDECQLVGENDFEDLCRFIASLASPKDHTVGVKVIVFSRPNYSDISDALSTFTEIRVDNGANDADLKLFITKKIDKILLKQSQDHRRDEIKETIREQADGMFLWVDLRVKDLQHLYSVKKIQKALETKSKGLNGLYRESMKSIPEAAREQAFKALLWLAYSRKSLSKSELLEALAVEDGETELTDDERLPANTPLCTMCADLLIDEGGYFQLIHASLKEFLRKKSSGIDEYDTLQRNAQLILAKTCLTYLTFDHLRSISCSTSDEVLQVLADYPLLGYAAQYWGDHFSAANSTEQNLHQLSSILLETPLAIGLSIKIFNFEELFNGHGRASTEASALHLLAISNLRVIAEYFPRLKESVNQPDCFDLLPIDYAMIFGSKEMVNWILEVYKEDQSKFSSCLSRCRVHLLASAAGKNWGDVVATLTTLGFEKDLYTKCHPRTALCVATKSGSHDALKILLDMGAEPNIWVGEDAGPLMSAVIAGDLHAVKLLLAANANTNIHDESGLTPLHHAARGDDQVDADIARALLDKGANIEAGGPGDLEENTPLCYTAWFNSMQVAEILLREGVDVERGPKDGISPLSLAVSRGHLDLANLLIQYGANTAPSLEYGNNLLHCAAISGSVEMVQMLLSRCGDLSFIDGKNANGDTPFSCSITDRLMPISLTLLNNGAIESLKEWAKELPPEFFPELYRQYLLHEPSDESSLPTIKATLGSLAMLTLNSQTKPETGDSNKNSKVLCVDTDAEQESELCCAQCSGSAPSNIAHIILTELISMHNYLLRLDQNGNEAQALRQKSCIFMNACYFSYIILNEENAVAFIHQIAYDEIMRIGNQIANCNIGQSISDEATDAQNSCGTGKSVADNRNDSDEGYGCDDDENGHDGSKQRELFSQSRQFDVDGSKVTLHFHETNSEEDPQETYTVDETVQLPTDKGKWWTELTRSLVVRDAIEELGYEFEERQYYFYVMKYLEYDDVAELVFLSEEMKQSGNAKYWFNARGSNWERYYLKVWESGR